MVKIAVLFSITLKRSSTFLDYEVKNQLIVATSLIAMLPWPGNNELTFLSSNQAATCFHTR